MSPAGWAAYWRHVRETYSPWQERALRRWGPHGREARGRLDSYGGDGPIAVLAWCYGSLTVMLCETREEAEQLVRNPPCCGGAHGVHEIVDMRERRRRPLLGPGPWRPGWPPP